MYPSLTTLLILLSLHEIFTLQKRYVLDIFTLICAEIEIYIVEKAANRCLYNSWSRLMLLSPSKDHSFGLKSMNMNEGHHNSMMTIRVVTTLITGEGQFRHPLHYC